MADNEQQLIQVPVRSVLSQHKPGFTHESHWAMMWNIIEDAVLVFNPHFEVAKLLQGRRWMQHKHCWSDINEVQHFVKVP